jgi:hypothetical protein
MEMALFGGAKVVFVLELQNYFFCKMNLELLFSIMSLLTLIPFMRKFSSNFAATCPNRNPKRTVILQEQYPYLIIAKQNFATLKKVAK